MPDRPTIAVGVTGASGAIYAVRTIAALLERGLPSRDRLQRLRHAGCCSTSSGRTRRSIAWSTARRALRRRRAARARSSSTATSDLGASLASGSHRCDGMVIVPCSMKTLAGVAHGLSRSLIERAADVMLKEKRRLVLVPRETPMSLPELRNMVACAEAGAMILPAMPAFYQQPKTIDDLADVHRRQDPERARIRAAVCSRRGKASERLDVEGAGAHRRHVRRDRPALRHAQPPAQRRPRPPLAPARGARAAR